MSRTIEIARIQVRRLAIFGVLTMSGGAFAQILHAPGDPIWQLPVPYRPHVEDGLSYDSASGGKGHFNGSIHNGGFPYGLAAPVSQGWTTQGRPTEFYTSKRGAYSYSAVYDYDDYDWILASGVTPRLTVIADFELWYSESGSAQEVYFHQGAGTGRPQQAIIDFASDSNNGEWWGITRANWRQIDQTQANHLAFLEDGFGVTDPGPSYPGAIPATWELSQDGGATWSPGQWMGGSSSPGWGYWWLLSGAGGAGSPGPFSYKLRITIDPSPRQNDGRYYFDAMLASKPAL